MIPVGFTSSLLLITGFLACANGESSSHPPPPRTTRSPNINESGGDGGGGDDVVDYSSTDRRQERPAKPPHVFFVLADDIGWGDVGFNLDKENPEVRTPNMDRLAREEGIHLLRHYVHHSCTGTRTSLQSGRLPVHVQTSLKNPEDPSSGMPRNMTGLGENMRMAGYAGNAHYVGKWDVGMATPRHTPAGRGYDTSLGYFEHKNDYWTQRCAQSTCCFNPYLKSAAAAADRRGYEDGDDVDVSDDHDGASRSGRPAAAATAERRMWEDGPPAPPSSMYQNLTLTDLWDTDRPARDLAGTDYEEFIFLRRMLSIIDDHDPSQPLFLFYAPHVAHCPLQVPPEYLGRFDFMVDDEDRCRAQTFNVYPDDQDQPPYNCRRQYRAMVNLLDELIGEVVSKFRSKGMWDDTLMVFTSDNGGPIDLEESGSTNHPLRGGKYSDWEGGVRAAAFVSGGYVPEDRRGTVQNGMVHIADWYATLPALAGNGGNVVGDERAREAGLPPPDAVNVWPMLAGEVDESPRREIPLSHDALIVGDHKLIWKDSVREAGWTGPSYPNASSVHDDPAVKDTTVDCTYGCLFDVANDIGEHYDLALTETELLEGMKSRLVELRGDFFENDDVGVDSCPDDVDMPCACWMAVNHYGGFFGPYQEVDLVIDNAAAADET